MIDICVSLDKIRKFGCESACLLVYLQALIAGYKSHQIADVSNGIPLSIDKIKIDLGLSRAQQDTAIERLVKAGYLKVERKGLPCKRYFTILKWR